MALFQYNAIDSSGKTLSGTIDAGGVQEAVAKLKSMGYFVTSVTPAKGSAQAKTKETRKHSHQKQLLKNQKVKECQFLFQFLL
jgi:type II secretory pathway component PulF